MSMTPLARAVTAAALGVSVAIPSIASAEFLKDSKASLALTNLYFDRDFRDQQSDRQEWGQGFIFKAESGFTEGTVGFGLDVYAGLGLKLDSGKGRTGTGMFPVKSNGRSESEYSEAHATAKVRLSKTIARAGGFISTIPVARSNTSRLMPQTFLGAHAISDEIDNLTVHLGQYRKVNQRDSTNFEDIRVNSGGRHRGMTFTGRHGNRGDNFNFGGLSYKVNKNLTTSYYYGQLEDMYKQHIFNVVHTLPIADKQSIRTDLRYAYSSDDGKSNIDNKTLNGMVTYNAYGHSLGAAYQKMSGDTGFAYLNGTDPFLVNYVQIGDFSRKDEKSWQLRYGYDFANVGVPGLTFMTRYISGHNIDRGASMDRGKEWERDIELMYVVQEGPLKNVGFRWRNAMMRSDVFGNINENRLIVSYTIPLL